MLRIAVVSLFPRFFELCPEYGIIGRALRRSVLELRTWNPRDYAEDRQRSVDDRPYGGGPGMVLMVPPVRAAIRAARAWLGADAVTLYLSPQGRRLDQAGVLELSRCPALLLLAGHYEGIDERLIQMEVDEEWSIGDYVLGGGESAALVLMDAVVRWLPGTLGDADSAGQDSFCGGLLEYPHYTRPRQIEGRGVPEVLLSGDHERIRRWRSMQSLGRTWRRRPDLLGALRLSSEQRLLLQAYIKRDRESGSAE